MKHIILSAVALMLLSACPVVLEPQYSAHGHGGYNYCYEDEPYYYEPVQSIDYYDYYSYQYEGVCSTWLVDSYHGRYDYEEWCNWVDTCGWEFAGAYTEYNYSH
jgi:hypothetical protein